MIYPDQPFSNSYSPNGTIVVNTQQNPHSTNPPWSREEDGRLLHGIREFGEQWKAIENKYFTFSYGYVRYVTRDSEQCAARYQSYWNRHYNVNQIQTNREKIQGQIFPLRNVFDTSNTTSYPLMAESLQPMTTLSFIDVDAPEETLSLDQPAKSPEQKVEKKQPILWSVEEDEWLLNEIKEFGAQWSEIVKKNFTSPDGHSMRNIQSCSNRWHHYWKEFYSVEQIKAIEGKIQVENFIEKGKHRRITNLFNTKIQQSEIFPIQAQESIVNSSQSDVCVTALLESPKQEVKKKKTIKKLNHKSPEVKKASEKKHVLWSKEEDELLLNGIQKFGAKWQKIADTYFTSPDGNIVRNRRNCMNRWLIPWAKLYTIEQIQAIEGKIKVEESTEKNKQVLRITNFFNTTTKQQAETHPTQKDDIFQQFASTINLEPPLDVSSLDRNIDSPAPHTPATTLLPSQLPEERKRSHGMAFLTESIEENNGKKAKINHGNSSSPPEQTSEYISDSEEVIPTPSLQPGLSCLNLPMNQTVRDVSQLNNSFGNQISYSEDEFIDMIFNF